MRDLKIAIRHLARSPGFSLTAVFMLALGIGATTAIFSIVEGVLLRPLPFPHPEQLVVLSDTIQGAQVGRNDEAGVTGPDIVNYTRDTHSFSALGGYNQPAFELSGIGDPAQINAARMTPGVFTALGVQPLLGRVFTRQEDDQHQQVAVLSYATWQSRFHGGPSIVGQKILLDRKPYLVIGIMPRNFEFPLVAGHLNRTELWIPMSFRPEELTGGAQANWSYSMVGRLRPGVTFAQARQDADRVARETMRNYPSFMADLKISPVVRGLHEDTIAQARPLIRALFLAVAVVLLIACANLAGLLLVRAIRRRREIAVRLALGSSASTLLRQALLESLVLSVSGSIVGLVLAAIALKIGTSFLPETLPLISSNGNGGYVVLRTSLPPEMVENQLRATVRSLDPQLPLTQLQTMEHAISDSEAPRRFNTVLISSFAAAARFLHSRLASLRRTIAPNPLVKLTISSPRLRCAWKRRPSISSSLMAWPTGSRPSPSPASIIPASSASLAASA